MESLDWVLTNRIYKSQIQDQLKELESLFLQLNRTVSLYNTVKKHGNTITLEELFRDDLPTVSTESVGAVLYDLWQRILAFLDSLYKTIKDWIMKLFSRQNIFNQQVKQLKQIKMLPVAKELPVEFELTFAIDPYTLRYKNILSIVEHSDECLIGWDIVHEPTASELVIGIRRYNFNQIIDYVDKLSKDYAWLTHCLDESRNNIFRLRYYVAELWNRSKSNKPIKTELNQRQLDCNISLITNHVNCITELQSVLAKAIEHAVGVVRQSAKK